MENLYYDDCYYDYCTPELDERLVKIKGLTWLPWVGKEYQKSERRVLIVGESHYEKKQEKIETIMRDELLSRAVIYEYAILFDWGGQHNPTFDNLNRAFYNDKELAFSWNTEENIENRKQLWKSLAFYNFIQRPMLYNSEVKERPTSEDFCKGWSVFIEIIKLLKPTDCLFIGTRASDFFEYMMSGLSIEHSNVTWVDVGARAYGRVFSLSIDSYSLKMLSIQHTSQFFSYPLWHSFIKEQNRSLLSFLDGIIGRNNEDVPAIEETTAIDNSWINNVPTWLKHKPIVACNYEDHDYYGDALFLSLGRAQYDVENDLAVKIMRWTGEKWSRQSEELPISRVFDCSLILLSTIKALQSKGNEIDNCYLHPQFIKEDEIGFVSDTIENHKEHLMLTMKEMKNLLNSIDLNLL